MFVLLLATAAAVLQGQAAAFPQPTVLLIALDAKTDSETQDYETAFPLTSLTEGVTFDLDGDGVLEQVAWTFPSARLAFLAMDLNENGIIDNGKELVGRQTLDTSHSGVDALGTLRERENPKLSGSVGYRDRLYQQLLLWHDANHNGISEPTELRPVREVLTEVGLGYSAFDREDEHGNRFRFKGWVEIRTAPGPNKSIGAKDHFERVRRMYEVVLKRSR
jgi:hypothetical protein